MLVLTRCLNESIVLPGLGITLRVAAVKGGAVRVGIEAPPNVAIVRRELLADAATETHTEPTGLAKAG